MRKYLHLITVAFILMGLLIGYGKADYDYDPLNLYNQYYYIWDKTKDVLVSLCVIFPFKDAKVAWVSLVLFFLIRAIWQIFAIQDYANANRPSIIFLLFLTEILVICIIMFYHIIKKIKWKRQRLK